MDKKMDAVSSTISKSLKEWLKTLPPDGTFKITLPPKRLSDAEFAELKSRMKSSGVDHQKTARKLLKAIEDDSCSR